MKVEYGVRQCARSSPIYAHFSAAEQVLLEFSWKMRPQNVEVGEIVEHAVVETVRIFVVACGVISNSAMWASVSTLVYFHPWRAIQGALRGCLPT